jgi:hypothetical protein
MDAAYVLHLWEVSRSVVVSLVLLGLLIAVTLEMTVRSDR